MSSATRDDAAGADESGGAASLVERVKSSRVMRTVQRYGKARGGLLAGGIAYSALFSIVAALTIAWTVFMATVGGDPRLRSQVIEAVNSTLPGILKNGSGQGMVDPDALVLDSALNPASIIAAFVLLWLGDRPVRTAARAESWVRVEELRRPAPDEPDDGS